ncbi:MmcQ/YjbR family DNA-binding protein [Haloferax sp. S1W]|uniref:MmcQ/YjbR family DNA-binding protein n=1 Tax=Haloferax sp. S1W TaxID=3377110 RepID=UPI0037CB64C9
MAKSEKTPTREQVALLATAVQQGVDSWPDVEQTTMFGCPSFRANGTLFAVVSEQGVSLTSLPREERAELAAQQQVVPFEANGRLVGSWATVHIDPSHVGDLEDAIRASYEAARDRKSK